ncbi:MAG: tetratricopeptide repeat protein [Lentisphaeria bacterium]|jgi:Flp pilus assembly protein TadD
MSTIFSPFRPSRLPAALLAGLLLLAVPLPRLAAAPRDDRARDLWIGGYLKFEEAAKEEKASNQLRALELYRTAVAVFQQVQAKYPDWNVSLLDYRIRNCQAKIAELEAAVATRNLDLSKSDLLTLTRTQDAQLKSISGELAAAKRQLAAALQARDRAQAESARILTLANQAEKLLQEKQALQDARLAAERNAERLQGEVARLESAAGMKAKAEELQRRLDLARARQAELEAAAEERLATLQTLNDKGQALSKEVQTLTAAQGKAEKAIAGLKADLKRQAEETTAREEDLDQARKEQRRLTDQLADERKLTAKLTARLEKAGKKREKPEQAATPPEAVAEQVAREQQLAALTRRNAELEGQVRTLTGQVASLRVAAAQLEASAQKGRQELASAKAAAAKPPPAAPAAKPAAPAPADSGLLQRYAESVALSRRLEERIRALEAKLKSPAAPAPADAGRETALLAQLAAAQQELARERAAKAAAPGSDALLDKLRQMNRNLDTEKERSRTLEAALQQATAKAASITPAAPAAPAPPPEPLPAAAPVPDDQLRRDRENQVREWLRQAVAAEGQKQSEAAVWNYKRVLGLQPDHKLAAKRLGLLLAAGGDPEESNAWLRKAFYLDPDDVEVLIPLGYSLVRQGKADLALSMLARAAALRPTDPQVHRAYGVACSSLGWLDAAEAQFRRTLEIAPADGEAAFNLAVLLATRQPERLKEARDYYRKARELGIQPDPGLDRLFGIP